MFVTVMTGGSSGAFSFSFSLSFFFCSSSIVSGVTRGKFTRVKKDSCSDTLGSITMFLMEFE